MDQNIPDCVFFGPKWKLSYFESLFLGKMTCKYKSLRTLVGCMYPVRPLWQPYTCFMGIPNLQSSNHIYWLLLQFFIPDNSYRKIQNSYWSCESQVLPYFNGKFKKCQLIILTSFKIEIDISNSVGSRLKMKFLQQKKQLLFVRTINE